MSTNIVTSLTFVISNLHMEPCFSFVLCSKVSEAWRFGEFFRHFWNKTQGNNQGWNAVTESGVTVTTHKLIVFLYQYVLNYFIHLLPQQCTNTCIVFVSKHKFYLFHLMLSISTRNISFYFNSHYRRQ